MNKTALEAAETRSQEFARLVGEYQHGDGSEKAEAWNLIADFAVDNAAVIRDALIAYDLRSPAPAPAETEEDRALANFDKIADSFFASNEAVLSAPAEGVAVRPLEWEEVHQRRSDEDPVTEVVGFEAPDGFGGFYTIVTNVADFTLSHGYDGKDTTHETERSAKAAAETHYQATIRSALLPSESAEKAGVVGWRPIKSAPLDKTTVALLYVRGNYRRYGVGWYMPLQGWQGWDFFVNGYEGPPTHWLPLPAAPASTSPATGEAK